MSLKTIKHAGKGARSEMLPSRGALTQIVGGSPDNRTINEYSAKTPDLGSPTPDILQMGRGSSIQ